ncbi:hypothetical protein [uncultured Lactobacillus sp.]|uniref:hypothetical protein n=1 Tax=uncultured Lactobacillus sp. TaxID=153152 RepID=UPI0028057F95|nr:hypothetical protein [uncultured Lactobacillus sp.]
MRLEELTNYDSKASLVAYLDETVIGNIAVQSASLGQEARDKWIACRKKESD